MPSLIVDALVVLAVGRRWERAIVAMVVSFRLFSPFLVKTKREAGRLEVQPGSTPPSKMAGLT